MLIYSNIPFHEEIQHNALGKACYTGTFCFLCYIQRIYTKKKENETAKVY